VLTVHAIKCIVLLRVDILMTMTKPLPRIPSSLLLAVNRQTRKHIPSAAFTSTKAPRTRLAIAPKRQRTLLNQQMPSTGRTKDSLRNEHTPRLISATVIKVVCACLAVGHIAKVTLPAPLTPPKAYTSRWLRLHRTIDQPVILPIVQLRSSSIS
jgi:hypothetical protein